MTDHQETPKAKILIIEDEALIALDLKSHLEQMSYRVLAQVNSAEKALEMIEQDPPDLVLMDIVLKGKMDGIEAADIIRSRWSIPVIFTTAYADKERIERAKLTYPFGYLLKPYQENDIKVTIEMALAISRVDGERRKAEQVLKESEEKFRVIFESAFDGILIAEVESKKFLMGNRSICRMLGYSKEEIGNLGVMDIHPPEDLPYVIEEFEKQARKEIKVAKDIPILRKDGTKGYVEVVSSPMRIGEKLYLLGMFRDITERKRAEEIVLRERDFSNTALNSLPGVFYLFNQTGKFLRWNNNFLQVSGYSPKELRRLTPLDLFHDPDRALVRERIEEVFVKGFSYVEAEFISKSGKGTPYYFTGQKIEIEGEPCLIGMGIDITERKQAEEVIKESEERYRLLFENAPAGIYEVDLTSGRFLKVNEVMCEYTGYTQEEFLALNVLDLLTEESQKLFLKRMASYAAGESVPQPVEFQALSKSGRKFTVSLSVKYFFQAGLPVRAMVVAHDITEHKRLEEAHRLLEERLQRSEKMEALGTLAGGVAHDLNNVLGVLVGYSELLMLDAPEGSILRDHASNILQAGQRAAAIIQDLLTLARRGVVVSKILNLNRIISDFLKTPECERMKSHHPQVTFRMELAPELLNIKGSPVHLSKTVMNLLSNGAEAVSGPGEVVIRTENRYIDKPLRGYEETWEGEYVLLMVSDTGSGIPQADLRKIFEPFYTKKVMGRSGTGLGLAVVWGTVKDHNGYIDVQSEEGQGSTFTLYFPVSREALKDDPGSRPRSDYLGKGESILVVDDVKEQRSLAATMLVSLGYRVHTVASGEEAVESIKDQPVDLLVLDMIMDPGIDGLETYERILEIRPGQKAIIVSGFSETDRIRKAQSLGAGAYVRKPYVLEKIGLAVRRELDK